ncbi:MAG: trigger factor [Chloroflexi bacterium]|nr:trigger factor [Chloroflexota bacterium]
MKVTTENVAVREVELTIEPDQQAVDRAMHKAAQQLTKWRPLSGYRPGKAPYAMVERVFGKDSILDEAIREIADDLYRQALTEANIQPYEPGHLDIESKDPVVLKVHVALMPEVDLGDYKSLHIEPEPTPTISEEQISDRLEAIRRQHAEYNPVERPAQIGDQIVASTIGVAEEHEVVHRDDQTLILSDSLQPAGYAEAILGMSAGEERTFALHYPEDYPDKDVAGKDVTFTVAMKTVRETVLPELNDDLAKAAGDFATLEDLRSNTAARLQADAEREVQQKERDAAIERLVENAKVEYPEDALKHEIENSLARQKDRLQQYGFTWPAYLKMIGKTEEQIREDIRPDAEKGLVRRLVVNKFAELENIDVTNEEMTNSLSNLAAAYGDHAQDIINQMRDRRALVSFYGDLYMEKSMRHLTALMTGREEEPAQETPADEVAADEANTADSAADESSNAPETLSASF